jgi:hypothetical protein
MTHSTLYAYGLRLRRNEAEAARTEGGQGA